MGSDGNKDDSSSNPFVQFKHHVDSNVSFGFNTMIGNQRGGSSVAAQPENQFQPSAGEALSLRSVLFSQYSPAALRHLPRPVPNDVPNDVDRNTFTFEDAFEDLLAISQGQELPEMTQKLQQKKLLHKMFPEGEPFWFWHRRLRASGLLGSYITDHKYVDQPDWDGFHQELDRKAEDVWGRTVLGPLQAIKAIGNIWDEIERSADDFDRYIKDKGWDNRQIANPDTFDELFESIQSAYNSGQRSWDTFMKTITDSQTPNDRAQAIEPQNKVIEDRNEYVDRFGYVHSKVTRKELDSDGNEVSSSTSYHIYPAPKDKNPQEQGSHEEEDDKKKTGWFWK
ncbi:unnamed protein product [Clonostachys chloroleuca]|uniref:Uncharacterized protein n=1 Tax=Clonostachys chloroleuca TaxID=1926264 RepID=A0AA35LYG4_9HYPO|nr:unnamed protein product [Clonostachys chloroleuca]